VKEDHRPVLAPNIGPLSVQGRRIVGGEEDLEDLSEGDDRRIELNLDNLCVAGTPRADTLIGRVRVRAPGIT
jgi:hypothetical protein